LLASRWLLALPQAKPPPSLAHRVEEVHRYPQLHSRLYFVWLVVPGQAQQRSALHDRSHLAARAAAAGCGDAAPRMPIGAFWVLWIRQGRVVAGAAEAARRGGRGCAACSGERAVDDRGGGRSGAVSGLQRRRRRRSSDSWVHSAAVWGFLIVGLVQAAAEHKSTQAGRSWGTLKRRFFSFRSRPALQLMTSIHYNSTRATYHSQKRPDQAPPDHLITAVSIQSCVELKQ